MRHLSLIDKTTVYTLNEDLLFSWYMAPLYNLLIFHRIRIERSPSISSHLTVKIYKFL